MPAQSKANRPLKPAPPSRDPLRSYRDKRDFTRTAEPKAEPGSGEGWQFVVQKHDARRLHFDLRVELDGVLVSWAVTRGPSLVPGEKRLAVHTEDHPMKYLDFEGVIPKGEYGGGTMIVWDRGVWTPEGDAREALKKGRLTFQLDGARLKGRWHIVRMRARPKETKGQWLLIKAEDEFALEAGEAELVDTEMTSLRSGMTNDELGEQGTVRDDHKARVAVKKTRKTALPDASKIAGTKKGILPVFVPPSLATLATHAPSGDRWVHEIKYDGYRMQVRIDGKDVQLLTRKSLDWTDRFPTIAAALKGLKLGSALIDGEIVVEETTGVSSFSYLQGDLKDGRHDRMLYYAFDLLYLEGLDLMKAPLLERKATLQRVLTGLPKDSVLRYSEHIETDGATMLEHACRLGLEGVISKRTDEPYRSGRGEGWLKSKCVLRQEFVVLGYSPSEATKGAVGSLLLGYYDNGKLFYAGRAGTGLTSSEARRLRNELEKITARKHVFANRMPVGADRSVRWAEPKLVAEIEYRGWSRDGVLRQAAYKGIREDKDPKEIVREKEVSVPNVARASTQAEIGNRTMAKQAAEKKGNRKTGAKKRVAKPAQNLGSTNEFAGVHLTNPDRVLWDDQGVTKQALAEFYIDIADWVMPHLEDRVLSLVRCPSGVMKHCFYAKHAWAGLDDAVTKVDVGEGEPMLAIHDLRGLISLVQSGVLEIHPWGSKVKHLERPDLIIIDLDPGEGLGYAEVIEGAHEVRERFKAMKLESFIKTSGGKGLHIVVPFKPELDWDTVKAFTKQLAEDMASDSPTKYVANMAKKLRKGRIFVDYLRNGRGQTAVAAYSTRARAGATVSVPIDWKELSENLRPDHFNIGNLRARLAHLKRDPWRDFFTTKQRLPKPKGRRS